jgi:ComF family protein
MHTIIRRLADDMLHLVAPALCPACDDPLEDDGRPYCAACRASMEPAPFPRELYVELLTHFPVDDLALSSLIALYAFERESPVQRLVHALKYHGCFDLGVQMGREIGRTMRLFPEFDEIDLVVPVPLHRARQRERGYNQAAAIAAGLAAERGILVAAELLRRERHTSTQTTLAARDRLTNVRRAFRSAAHEVRGRVALLCDDVCTTGATLNACADALLVAGASRVVAATFAKDKLV